MDGPRETRLGITENSLTQAVSLPVESSGFPFQDVSLYLHLVAIMPRAVVRVQPVQAEQVPDGLLGDAEVLGHRFRYVITQKIPQLPCDVSHQLAGDSFHLGFWQVSDVESLAKNSPRDKQGKAERQRFQQASGKPKPMILRFRLGCPELIELSIGLL